MRSRWKKGFSIALAFIIAIVGFNSNHAIAANEETTLNQSINLQFDAVIDAMTLDEEAGSIRRSWISD